jgi:CheY-like chemotaxis protein/anti-sigma regulatory factor (Ser/Thr protein kinase)
VNAVVSSSVATFAPAAKAKGLVLRAEGDPDAPLAWADQGRLEQVLYNLLSNAIKFTATGEVRAEVRHDASTVFLEVSDTGVGIPKEFLPHIFDRFRQADSSVTRAHGGLGLGLSIVREVVYLHGGQVKVASEEGKGTTFTVSLPRAPGEGAKQEVRDPDAPPDDGLLEGLEVLVIDDEEDSRELVRTILREHGAHVRVAASAAEGFDLLAQGATDVIVSDIGMEGQDGYSFIRDVKRGPARDTPALALTAFAHSEDRQRALQSGFDDYLSKPVDARVLVRTIQDLASHAKASDTQHFE